jgi:hypothetical protein
MSVLIVEHVHGVIGVACAVGRRYPARSTASA